MESDGNKTPSSDQEFLNIPRIYSNAVKVSRSLYDFQLIFGNAVMNNLGDEPKQIVEAKHIVQLSPQHFKVLCHIFNKQLAAYEKEFGEIQLPSEQGDSPSKHD
ncbi:MAG: DUF3467 domain-containing protein [candidate division Zixibacteria bacterium]|nr:DUF3467 domain-containing protein [candidate division Zixibacteria bacterium]